MHNDMSGATREAHGCVGSLAARLIQNQTTRLLLAYIPTPYCNVEWQLPEVRKARHGGTIMCPTSSHQGARNTSSWRWTPSAWV